jgi:membrane protease YdiL (CAAX protease family)
MNTLYTQLAPLLFLATLCGCLWIGLEHLDHHPQRRLRSWRRFYWAFWALALFWVSMAGFLLIGVSRPVALMGLNMLLQSAFQWGVALVGLPAALWFLARTDHGFRPRRWIPLLLVGVGVAILSQVLLLPFHPRLTPEASRAYSREGWREFGLLLAVLLAVPVEEIIFRGVLQGRLELWSLRRGLGASVPIVATSFLWALGHSGIVLPVGLKETQIFFFGLLLGWIRRRWGLTGAMAAHGGLNGFACVAQALQWILKS